MPGARYDLFNAIIQVDIPARSGSKVYLSADGPNHDGQAWQLTIGGYIS